MRADEWLGLVRVDATTWTMAVTPSVVAGSGSLYGGCATGAAVTIGRALTEHTPRWASTHFTGLARGGTALTLRSEVLAAGRSVTHLRVQASVEEDGRVAFTAHLTYGDRTPVVDRRDPPMPLVVAPDEAPVFDHRSHDGTFAARFEWRSAAALDHGSAATWWVRPREPVDDAGLLAAVLCDYVTYGIGRATGEVIGGLSVDNGLRLHDVARVPGWSLLRIDGEGLDGAFGSGTARVWREDGTFVASGSQTMVLNGWDWRQAGE